MKCEKGKACVKVEGNKLPKPGPRCGGCDKPGKDVVPPPRCAECGCESDKPLEKVELSFDFKDARYGVADWDDRKVYCCVTCMMKALAFECRKALKKFYK